MDNAISGKKREPVSGGIVISTAVRLARNIEGIPFPIRLNTMQKTALGAKILTALGEEQLPLKAVNMSSLYPYEAAALAEQHLISPEFATATDGRILLLTEDKKISIMLCEQDHIRITATEQGLAPEKAYINACKYDDAFDRRISYAFDNRLGFLNQNPGDLGTGMRVSAVMHLPALARTGEMTHLTSTVSKLGFKIRGYYGDSSSVKGDVFSISNTVTMGLSENESITNLKNTVLQLESKERDTATAFVQEISVQDKIRRALALLQSAMLLPTDEMTEMLSLVRLGTVYGVIKADTATLDTLFTAMQPACINVAYNAKLTTHEQEQIRAKTVREALASAE